MKYVPVSNVYYLAIMMGCSDLMTSLVFNLANRKLTSKQIISISTFFLAVSALVLTISIWITWDDVSDISQISRGL
jgi:hypothetical protein